MSFVLELDTGPVPQATVDVLIASTARPEFVSLVRGRRRRPWDQAWSLWFDARQAADVCGDHASLAEDRLALSGRRSALARTAILLAAELESAWTIRAGWYGDEVRRDADVSAYELADLVHGNALRRDTAYRVSPARAPLASLSDAFVALGSVERSLPTFVMRDVVLDLGGPGSGTLRWRTCARWSADAATYVRGAWTDGGCALSCPPGEDLLLQPLPDVGETTGPAFLPRCDLLHLTALAAREPIAQRALAAVLATAHADPDPESLAPAVELARARDWGRFVACLRTTDFLPPVHAEALVGVEDGSGS